MPWEEKGSRGPWGGKTRLQVRVGLGGCVPDKLPRGFRPGTEREHHCFPLGSWALVSR